MDQAARRIETRKWRPVSANAVVTRRFGRRTRAIQELRRPRALHRAAIGAARVESTGGGFKAWFRPGRATLSLAQRRRILGSTPVSGVGESVSLSRTSTHFVRK